MRQSIERQPLKADNETCGQQLWSTSMEVLYCDCYNDTDVLYVDAIQTKYKYLSGEIYMAIFSK